jgi:hypothetical protein
MDPATNPNPSSKRVRIDASASMPTSSRKDDQRKPPKTLAESFIRSHVVSLQPQLATILEKLGIQHVNLLAKAHSKATVIQRMEADPSFIPRSARIEFSINLSKKAEATAEFQTLHAETERMLQDFRLGLRRQVISAAKIEYNVLSHEIQTDLAMSLRIVTQAFLIGESQNMDVDDKVFGLIDNFHETVLSHVKLDRTNFCQLYKDTHNLEKFPSERIYASAAQQRAQSPFFSSTEPAEAATVLTSNRSGPNAATPMLTAIFHDVKLKRIIESVFIAPWTQYLDQVKKNEIVLELKKLSTDHFTEQSTTAAAMRIDDEPAADRQLLMELIKKETKAETKTLQNEIKQLRDTIKTLRGIEKNPRGTGNAHKGKDNAKNRQRGPASGASKKKENAAQGPNARQTRTPPPRRQTKQKNNHTDHAADASDSDSHGDSGGRRRNRDTRRKQQQGRRSQTPKRRQSSASARKSD